MKNFYKTINLLYERPSFINPELHPVKEIDTEDYFYAFDKNGRLIKSYRKGSELNTFSEKETCYFYNQDGQLYKETVEEFIRNNNGLKIYQDFLNLKTPLEIEYVYSYEKNTRCLYKYINGEPLAKIIYDENNNIIEDIEYKSIGNLLKHVKFNYDQNYEEVFFNGELSSKTHFMKMPEKDIYIAYKYAVSDTVKFKKSKKLYLQTETKIRKIIKSNKTIIEYFSVDYEPSSEIYPFSRGECYLYSVSWIKNNLIIKNLDVQKLNMNFQDYDIEEYEHCDDADCMVLGFDYEFDKYGNWIAKRVLEKGRVINVDERVINYY